MDTNHPPVGFGNALGLNAGTPGAAENYMQVYVRTRADCLLATTAQGMDFVGVCGGTFDISCTAAQQASGTCEDDESPVHSVTLTNDFWMSETEVTQGQWEALMGNNPAYFGPSGGVTARHPHGPKAGGVKSGAKPHLRAPHNSRRQPFRGLPNGASAVVDGQVWPGVVSERARSVPWDGVV